MAEIIDVDSFKGRFGWISIRGLYALCTARIVNGKHTKFVTISTAETVLLGRYLHYFNPDIYKCLSVKGYYITKAEAKLLNNINKQYCSYMFGNYKFIAGKDCIVHLEDALELYTFLDVCHKKIHSNINDDPEIQFGFIKFESNFIPYFTKEGQKYLPRFFFEDSIDDLLLGTMELKNWDLAYLKFCFKVMGIHEYLYNTDSCTVISFNDLINYLPSGTIIEDFWPKDLYLDSRITSRTTNDNEHRNKPGFWITDYLGSSIMPQESSTTNNANQV